MEQNPEEDTSVLQWKQLMQKLLVVLNKTTFSGLFSEKVDEPQACRPSADEYKTYCLHQNSGPGQPGPNSKT